MVLEAYYGLYVPIEQRLLGAADWPTLNFALSRRLKAPLIRADLAYFGLAEREIEALPRCDCLPWTPDLPAALGCMSVLESSTLDGQVLPRLHRRAGARTPRRPLTQKPIQPPTVR